MTRLFLGSKKINRRKHDDAHRFIGRSIGSHDVSDDVSHPEKLSEGMKTEDGPLNLWDVSDQTIHKIKGIVEGGKKRGHEINAYYQIDGGPIERWYPDEITRAEFVEMMNPLPELTQPLADSVH